MDHFKLNTWKRKYMVVGLLAVVGPASPQYPMQMFQMPAMMMMAPPQASSPASSPAPSPATTTEPPPPDPDNKGPVAFAVPVPMPMPLQIAVPALPPPSFCSGKPCPPCPPCLCAPACTPSFFSYCSPCHNKCRCKDGKEPPEPLPPVPPRPAPGPAFALPMPMPPPALMVPMPPFPVIPQERDSCSSESRSNECSSSSEYCDDSSSDYDDGGSNKKKWRRGKRKPIKKKSRRGMDGEDDVDRYVIKPIISFLDSSGAVQMKRALSAADVRALTADSLEEGNQQYLAWLRKHNNKERAPSPATEMTILQNIDDNLNPPILIIQDFRPNTNVKKKNRAKLTKKEISKTKTKT